LTALAADSVGIPACDDFLAKYQACITDKAPADQKTVMEGMVSAIREDWVNDVKTKGSQQVEDVCRQAPAEMRDWFSSQGCSY